MNGFHLAWLSLWRRKPATVVAIAALTLITLASSLVVSILTPLAQPLDELRTEYNLIIGPKSSNLGILLRSLLLWQPDEELIPYSLGRVLRHRQLAEHIVPLHFVTNYLGSPVIATHREYLERPEQFDRPRLIQPRNRRRWSRKPLPRRPPNKQRKWTRPRSEGLGVARLRHLQRPVPRSAPGAWTLDHMHDNRPDANRR